jgi:hypothetical protein
VNEPEKPAHLYHKTPAYQLQPSKPPAGPSLYQYSSPNFKWARKPSIHAHPFQLSDTPCFPLKVPISSTHPPVPWSISARHGGRHLRRISGTLRRMALWGRLRSYCAGMNCRSRLGISGLGCMIGVRGGFEGGLTLGYAIN